MNKPIRTLSIFCMLLFAALLLNSTYLQYVEAGSLNSRGRQQAGARRGVLPQARRDRGRRRRRSRESGRVDDQYKYQRVYTAAAASTPR